LQDGEDGEDGEEGDDGEDGEGGEVISSEMVLLTPLYLAWIEGTNYYRLCWLMSGSKPGNSAMNCRWPYIGALKNGRFRNVMA
jgi:hypothetical protein